MSGRERRHGALHLLAGLAGGFAAGTIPTGELVTRVLTGKRLSELGDGKTGSSNVARSVGWKAGALVLALDALKAYAPATTRWPRSASRRCAGTSPSSKGAAPHRRSAPRSPWIPR